MVPALNREQSLTSHLPKGFAVEMTAQPPGFTAEQEKTKHQLYATIYGPGIVLLIKVKAVQVRVQQLKRQADKIER